MTRVLHFSKQFDWVIPGQESTQLTFRKGERRALLSAGEKAPDDIRQISHAAAEAALAAGHAELVDGQNSEQGTASAQAGGTAPEGAASARRTARRGR